MHINNSTSVILKLYDITGAENTVDVSDDENPSNHVNSSPLQSLFLTEYHGTTIFRTDTVLQEFVGETWNHVRNFYFCDRFRHISCPSGGSIQNHMAVWYHSVRTDGGSEGIAMIHYSYLRSLLSCVLYVGRGWKRIRKRLSFTFYRVSQWRQIVLSSSKAPPVTPFMLMVYATPFLSRPCTCRSEMDLDPNHFRPVPPVKKILPGRKQLKTRYLQLKVRGRG